ncbi:MAG: undecaprenyldiphospho-muramoylpentapeptide beta-N-acetylglucosaminyltransferase [Mariprofundaceae bacterium]|nr:undecaprenyldiphospho-muramoylpentapeptide beta-N-acetylglucosaminyltransferase [Mariprofundaceae bacterium]
MNSCRTLQLCIAGGGTGGHVMPALALADAARQRWQSLQVSFIGAERGLEAQLLPERGEDVLLLKMHAVQGVGLLHKLRVLLWEMPRAVYHIRRHWKKQSPTLLVGVGGYASATGVIAAIINRIPVVLYEQNAVPGLVNRTLARFSKCIMLGFTEAEIYFKAKQTVHTGNIVRTAIANTRWKNHSPPCLLVLGGSQGARFLNQTVPQACIALHEQGKSFTVVHVCGGDESQRREVEDCYQKVGITAKVMSFCTDMPNFYACGSLMIARAGAMTVAEANSIGLPSIFVPLPHAADQHQTYNARSLSDQGAALLFEQQDNNANTMAKLISDTLFNSQQLQAMHKASCLICIQDAKQRQLDVLSLWLEKEGLESTSS